MSFFGKLFNTEKEENNALTKEQKQIEKKLKKLNHMNMVTRKHYLLFGLKIRILEMDF